MDRKNLKGDAMILAAVVTWALAYPIAKGALDPSSGWGKSFCTFVALRFFLAFALFLPVVLWRYGWNLKKYFWPSICVGGSAVVVFYFQSWAYTVPGASSGTIAFITSLAVVLVPLWSWLRGTSMPKAAVVGMAIATVGLAFMSFKQDFALDQSALLALVSAFGFTAYIILLGKFRKLTGENGEPLLDALPFAAMQFLMTALMMAVLALVFEVPAGLPPLTERVASALVYLVLGATVLGMTLQAKGQRYATNVHVALLCTLEPVIAAFAGYLILSETFTPAMLAGAVLILFGTVFAEVKAATSKGAAGQPPADVDTQVNPRPLPKEEVSVVGVGMAPNKEK